MTVDKVYDRIPQICERCGGSIVENEDSIIECWHCGTQYNRLYNGPSIEVKEIKRFPNGSPDMTGSHLSHKDTLSTIISYTEYLTSNL